MNALLALRILDIILLGVTLTPNARTAAQQLAERLRGFEGKDPTETEWDVLNKETDTLLARLRTTAR